MHLDANRQWRRRYGQQGRERSAIKTYHPVPEQDASDDDQKGEDPAVRNAIARVSNAVRRLDTFADFQCVKAKAPDKEQG
jgi:hypothetical protein